MVLTDVEARTARPGPKDAKLFDAGGLYLLVKPNGARYWRLKYRHLGRERKLSLGVYPDVSLKDARAARDDAKRLLREGKDPKAARSHADSFELVAREWLELQAKPPKNSKKRPLADITVKKATWMLEAFVFPHLGRHPVAQIDSSDLLAVLKRIEDQGFHETAHRTKWRCGQIFRYAKATGRGGYDLTADLKGTLAPVMSTSHAALTNPADVGALLRAIQSYEGQPSTMFALRLLPYVFLRSRELRLAEWSEIDFDTATWRIPGPRMKMRDAHIVPLADQALAILRELHTITGGSKLIFPGLRSGRPLSDMTINAALRRLGYSREQQTGHGFRTIASTLLNEQEFAPDVIELQLAHKERNKVRGAYNQAQQLTKRRKMMQSWADYLDTLRAGGNVVSIFGRP